MATLPVSRMASETPDGAFDYLPGRTALPQTHNELDEAECQCMAGYIPRRLTCECSRILVYWPGWLDVG